MLHFEVQLFAETYTLHSVLFQAYLAHPFRVRSPQLQRALLAHEKKCQRWRRNQPPPLRQRQDELRSTLFFVPLPTETLVAP